MAQITPADPALAALLAVSEQGGALHFVRVDAGVPDSLVEGALCGALPATGWDRHTDPALPLERLCADCAGWAARLAWKERH